MPVFAALLHYADAGFILNPLILQPRHSKGMLDPLRYYPFQLLQVELTLSCNVFVEVAV